MGLIHGDLFVDNVLFDGDALGGAARLRAGVLGAAGLRPGGDRRWRSASAATTFAPTSPGRCSTPTRALRPPTADERAAFGAELRFAACRFAVTRITDVHLKQGAGAAPGKRFQRYLARLASVQGHLATRRPPLALRSERGATCEPC